MSCNTCQEKFTFFMKNIGCPHCGFSYCNKCLKYKCDIPTIGKKKVCGPCYNKLNKTKESDLDSATNNTSVFNACKESLAPIDIAMKLNSLENPTKPPIVIYKHTNHWDKLKEGLEPVDQQILDRLQKLKYEQNASLPTIDEIQERLVLLKDQDPETSRSNVTNIYHQVDIRTNQEKADDLIQECLAEIELPSTSDPCKEIQDRLSLLQDKNYVDNKKEKINDIYKKQFNITSDDVTEVINMFSATTTEIPDAEDEEEDDKDENECIMCSQSVNESGLYKCTGCDNDFYCLTCFKSFHDESEIIEKHKAIRFIKQDKENDLLSKE